MIDPEGYNSVVINAMRSRVFKGNTLVGSVRRGMDGLWYAEQLGERHRSAAIHRVILANEAIEKFTAATHGHD